MNIDTRVQFGMLVVAAMSLGWSIGYYSRSDRIDTLEKQLASYKQAKKLDLSETVKEIENTNNIVENNLSEIRAHFEWRDEKKKARRKNFDVEWSSIGIECSS